MTAGVLSDQNELQLRDCKITAYSPGLRGESAHVDDSPKSPWISRGAHVVVAVPVLEGATFHHHTEA